MNTAEEIKRLATPDTAPSLRKYLLEKHAWVYVASPVLIALWVLNVFFWSPPWWATFAIATAFGMAGFMIGRAAGQWRVTAREIQDNQEWVKQMTAGKAGFPLDLAWTMCHLINEGKTNMAAAIALGYFEEQEKKL